jgi:hypothetical protein
MANRYWVGGSGTWDNTNTANWSTTSGGSGGASVPISGSFGDTAIFDSNSGTGTITLSGTPGCGSLVTTGSSFTFSGAVTFSMGGQSTFSATTTWNNTGNLEISSTGTLITNGVVFNCSINLKLPTAGSSLTLGDNLTCTGTFGFLFGLIGSGGRFFSNGKNMSVGAISDGGFNQTIYINPWTFAGSTVTLTGAGTVWLQTVGSTIINPAKIIISNNSGTTLTFAGGGSTYGALQFISSAVNTYVFTGANTWTGTWSSTLSNAATITLPASVTTTVGGWSVSGSSGNLVTLNSDTPGTQATLNYSGSGAISTNFLSLQDIAATPPSSTWYTGSGSLDNGNVTGWIFVSFTAGAFLTLFW